MRTVLPMTSTQHVRVEGSSYQRGRQYGRQNDGERHGLDGNLWENSLRWNDRGIGSFHCNVASGHQDLSDGIPVTAGTARTLRERSP